MRFVYHLSMKKIANNEWPLQKKKLLAIDKASKQIRKLSKIINANCKILFGKNA